VDKLRVGVIGLGVGARHVRCYEAHEACEVTTLCDLDADKLKEVGERYPGRRMLHEADAVLTDPNIDVVSIASHDDAHHRQVLTALDAGKHVFVEKPMCLRAGESREIQAALKAKPQLRLSSNHVLRVSSRFQELKRQIQAGDYGDVYYLEGDYLYGRLHKITSGWRAEMDHYSVMLGGGVHVIDLLLWLTDSEPEEVTAFGNKIASRDTAFRYQDMVAALIRMKSGIIAKVTANFGCRRPHYHAVQVYGTKRTFVNHTGPAEVYSSIEKGAEPEPMDVPYYDYQKPELIGSFVDWILDRGEPIVPPQDVFRTMATCFAVEEAAATGKPTPVDY